MLERFNAKKKDILDKLSQPDRDYTDASPKGSVDEGIRTLVTEINNVPGFVTTSSCAGRVAVFLEGAPKQRDRLPLEYDNLEGTSVKANSTLSTSTGGKGGGRWLFTSHAPVDLKNLSDDGSVFHRFGFTQNSQMSFPSWDMRPQFVHFKYEPMILHILCSSSEKAQDALNAAMAAGFRESGISGVVDSKSRPTPPMVAVRSSGLALDSIIGFQYPASSTTGTQEICPMVSEAYLRTLIQVANERFEVNEERKSRFRHAFLEQAVGVPVPTLGTGRLDRRGYESVAIRKERKRREGLLKKQQMLAHALDGADGDAAVKGADDEDDDADLYGVDLLMGVNGHESEAEESREAQNDVNRHNHVE